MPHLASTPVIHVGNTITKQATAAMAESICQILKVCYDTRASDELTKAAIKALVEVSEVKNTSISNSSFKGL